MSLNSNPLFWAALALAMINVVGAFFAFRKLYARRSALAFEVRNVAPYGLGVVTGILAVPFFSSLEEFGAIAAPRLVSLLHRLF